MMNMSCCDIKIEKDYALIKVEGAIARIHDCISITNDINKLIEAGISLIILDLSKVPFVSASFCGFLVSSSKKSKENKSNFALVIPSKSEILEMLKAVGMDRIIAIYSTKKQLFNTFNMTPV